MSRPAADAARLEKNPAVVDAHLELVRPAPFPHQVTKSSLNCQRVSGPRLIWQPPTVTEG